MYDLAVIGGGPAGTAAAITAARSGASVLLLERGSFPRHKVCGEFVSAESLGLLLSLLGSGAAVLKTAPQIGRGRLYIDGRVLETPIDPPAASISRYELDEGLWNAAVQAGVDARQQQTVTAVDHNGKYVIATAEGTFDAGSVINASSRWSNLSARLSPSKCVGAKWIGLKAHFAEPSPSPSVDLYFFGQGYCGVQPVGGAQGGEVNVCAMVNSSHATSLTQVFELHSALKERARSWRQITDTFSTSPLIFRTPEPTASCRLNAGDAAAFVDPFVGDGISLALRSGALAADCLVPFWTGKTSLKAAAEAYRVAYNRHLLPVYRTSSRIRRLLRLPYPARAALLLLLGNMPALTRYFVRRTR